MSSSGVEGSMSVIVRLLVWRFVSGIGFGSGCLLSNINTAEHACSFNLISA